MAAQDCFKNAQICSVNHLGAGTTGYAADSRRTGEVETRNGRGEDGSEKQTSSKSESEAFTSSRSNLPPELIEQILSEPSLSTADLSAFSLASRTFLALVRPKLWQSASFMPVSQVDYTVFNGSAHWLVLHPNDAAKSAFFRENPSLAACVRQLAFEVKEVNYRAQDGSKWRQYVLANMVERLSKSPRDNSRVVAAVKAWKDARHGAHGCWEDLHAPLRQMSYDPDVWLKATLALFPRLETLVVAGPRFRMAPAFSGLRPPPLRRLTLDTNCGSRRFFGADLVAVLSLLPSLSSLSILSFVSTTPNAFSFIAPTLPPPSFRSLSLSNLNSDALHQPGFPPLLAWMTSNSGSSLQRLSLPYPIDLSAHFPHRAFLSLRTLDLHVSSQTWYDPSSAQNFASVFPAVEDLRVLESFGSLFRPAVFFTLFSDPTALPALESVELSLGKMYLAKAWADEGSRREVVEAGAARGVTVVTKL
ncbi:hypothetical protein JCM10213_001805 [Rhodosporidiobolus nylandii]